MERYDTNFLKNDNRRRRTSWRLRETKKKNDEEYDEEYDEEEK